MPYEVQTPVFEGPFDLLLHLILRQQVDLYEVSLTTVVDGYLAEMARVPAPDLEAATEFLVIAATLVELKSRRLLPVPAEGEDDLDPLPWEERDLLLSRLLACSTFKEAARALERLAAAAARSWPRRAGLEAPFAGLAPDLLAGVTPRDVAAAARRALAPRPEPRVDLDHVAPIRASVREAVDALLAELPGAGRTTFRRLTEGLAGRLEVVVRFLALLELFKQGVVELDQPGTFGDITVVWLGFEGDDVAGVRAGAEVYD